MFSRARYAAFEYPSQFWLLFGGSLVNSTGASMIWPFVAIYVRQTFDVPLSQALSLFALEAAAGFVSTLIAGSLMDRIGRKSIMVLSLFLMGASWFSMSRVNTFLLWTIVVGFRGMMGPMFRVGTNAMVADLVPRERRASGYALMRIIANLGVAIGPWIGGLILAGGSYNTAFMIATAANWFFATLILLFARETIPGKAHTTLHEPADTSYLPVLRDLRFMAASFVTAIAIIPGFIMFSSIAVYTKEAFGLTEDLSSKIIATNAIMIVVTQLFVTRFASRYRILSVLAAGALLYGISTAGMALSTGFWHFWTAMVVLTIGEMLLVPTSTALVANLAPEDMRGRYMGVFNVSFIVGRGIGPTMAGWLYDNVAPQAMWWGAAIAGFTGFVGFVILNRVAGSRRADHPGPPDERSATAVEA